MKFKSKLFTMYNYNLMFCIWPPWRRGVKGLLHHTWLSVFKMRERWKYEIKTRELWLVCLLWYVNFKSPDIRDFQLIFSWNSLNWRQILQGSQWTFKWTFLKGLKKLKGRLFKRSLASGWQNRVLSHFQVFQCFYLNTGYGERFMEATW